MPNAPVPPPRPGDSLPSAPGNRINVTDASIIGDFMVTLADEMRRANKTLMSDRLSGIPAYAQVKDVHVTYTMTLDVKVSSDDQTRDRTTNVTIDADIKNVCPPDGTLMAPFSLASGNIGPAESARDSIELALKSNGLSLGHPPIFAIGGGKYWVKSPLDPSHYVVKLLSDPPVVQKIASIDELNAETSPMFEFMSKQLTKIYGDNNVSGNQ